MAPRPQTAIHRVRLQDRQGSAAEGRQLHYHDVGEGPVVLFVHGSGPGASSYSNFKGNFEVFVRAGYRVLLPDLPGYGGSDKPTDVAYTSAFMRDVLHSLPNSVFPAQKSLHCNTFPRKTLLHR